MLKLYDWECQRCGAIQEHAVEVPAKMLAALSMRAGCRRCKTRTTHKRLMSAPAPYVGEKTVNPRFGGGSGARDTLGMVRGPSLPELPDELCKTGDVAGIREFFGRPEYKEIERQRKVIAKQNAAKQKRNKAMKAGWHINMRRDRLPGDPKI